MHYVRIMTAVLAISLVALAGCGKKAGEAARKDNSPVLAEVNGSPITKAQFETELKNLPPQLQPMAQSQDGKKELLESMIIREIVYQDALKQGMDNTPEFKDRLEDVKKKLLVEMDLKKKLDGEVNMSDDDLKKVYEQYKDKFKTGDQVRASHILVKDEKTAQEVEAQLKKGANFADLAKKYSTDSSAAKGGDLGWFEKGKMVPEFEKAAFGMAEGQVSGIIKTNFGYHIIKVTGKRSAGYAPFSEVKDQIKAAILPSKQQEVFQKIKGDLKKGAKIEIKDPAFKKDDAAAPKPAEEKK